MRVWLIQGRQGEDAGGLDGLLRQWAQQAAGSPQLDRCAIGPDLAAEVRARRTDLLVLAEPACPAGPWAEEVLAAGVGLVVAVVPARAEPFRALAEQHPVVLVPLPPRAEALGLALLTAEAALRRQRHAQAQLEQLQQRLNDRIVIERAKGVLVRRLNVTEEEAYRRLRLLSRRQRRPIRDIGQALLDAQELLGPDAAAPGEVGDGWDGEPPVAPSERVPGGITPSAES
jgi:hypothetical protein